MKTQIVVIVLFALVALAIADRECRINTGDVFSGRYPTSRSTFAGLKVYFIFGADGKSGIETTHSLSTFVEFEVDDDEELAVRDFGVNPEPSAGCDNDIIGTYKMDWDFYKNSSQAVQPSCLAARLLPIQDACHERRMHYEKLVLTRVRKTSTVDCGFYPEQTWDGKYPNNNNIYGGHDVSFTFGHDGESAIEYSDLGTFFVEWENVNTGKDRSLSTLAVRDFNSNPVELSSCDVLDEGQYSLVWDQQTCRSVTLRLNTNRGGDDCVQRREQYDGLTLTRRKDFEPFHVGNDDDDAAISLKFSLFTFALCVLFLFF